MKKWLNEKMIKLLDINISLNNKNKNLWKVLAKFEGQYFLNF